MLQLLPQRQEQQLELQEEPQLEELLVTLLEVKEEVLMQAQQIMAVQEEELLVFGKMGMMPKTLSLLTLIPPQEPQ